MKFQVGEIAILAVVLPGEREALWPGQEVEVLLVGPFKGGENVEIKGHLFSLAGEADYVIGEYLRWICSVPESHLRKRGDPAVPESILRIFEEPVSA